MRWFHGAMMMAFAMVHMCEIGHPVQDQLALHVRLLREEAFAASEKVNPLKRLHVFALHTCS